MFESVEDDDNMIVLVVEDEYSKDDQQVKIPFPVQIKVESLDNSIKEILGNEIFNTLSSKDGIVKEECHDTEYLEEDENGENSDLFHIEYLEEEFENDQDYSDHEYKSSRNITQKKTPHLEYDSYVEKLRKENPKMAKNEQILVQHLACKMRDIRPPDPPESFCKITKVEKGKHKYECEFCGAQRDTLPLAERHYQFKHGEMYLTCYACGTNYKNTTSLYKHEKRCRAPDAPIVLRARGQYLGRKGRGRPFTTTNRFITSRMLQNKNIKCRYVCTKCPATFLHRDNLEAHENSHEGLRPYPCPHCITAYTSARALKRHMSAVHGDERYICDHCGKKFRVKPALVSHLDTHRTFRKHPCQYCERRFAQKPALQHHMNKMHLNLPAVHACPVCPKRYARITHVKEHMDRAHGLMMITRNMFFQSLPTMTEKQLIHARNLFNFGVNQITESEYIIPDIVAEPNVKHPVAKNTDIITGSIHTISRYSTDKIMEDETIQESIMPKGGNTEQMKSCVMQPKNDKILYKLKKKRNTTIIGPSNKKVYSYDGERHKLVSKRMLTNRKKVYIPMKNFSRLVMNKMYIDNSETKEDKLENLVLRRESLENLETDTEIPDDVPQMVIDDGGVIVDEDLKDSSDENVKDKVIAEFLEYMRTGEVPKHMLPVLRSRRHK